MASYIVRDSVAIIELDNAPVNALSVPVRTAIHYGVRRAEKDPAVKAVVMCGKGGNFCAGGNFKNFDEHTKEPWIIEIGNFIDSMKTPVVAAIEGVALGGGLELALFCHYRIAVKTARFVLCVSTSAGLILHTAGCQDERYIDAIKQTIGSPEVHFGFIPWWGGVVRLPKAAGLENALGIIVTGNLVTASNAVKMGIIDRVVSGDIIKESIKYAKSKAHINTRLPCLRHRKIQYEGDIDAIADAHMAKVKTEYRGYIAPIACVKTVIASVKMPYEKAIEYMLETFLGLKDSSQSKAMRYTFFAERQTNKWQLPSGGNYKTARPVPVRTSGVVGAGTMGSGIALCLVASGIPCILVEQSQEFLNEGRESMEASLMDTVRLGKMTVDQAKKCLAILKTSTQLEELRNVDLVIEAVYEDLKLKRVIFEKLDHICKPETILCTNTSTLDIDSIATATKRQDKVVGTHFFAPSYTMKLLENIYGTTTSAETVATVMKLGKTIRKVPVLVGSCTGFVANRMNGPYSQEARFIIEEGSTPSAVDNILTDFGMLMGTFQMNDLSGIGVEFRIRREAVRKCGVELTPETRYFNSERNCSLTERLVEKGRLGMKVGKGWYRYDGPNGKKAYVDPEVTQLIEDHCKQLGIERRNIGSQEVMERLQYSMINEGFKILEEGICSMPEEIDIIWIYGFTWPKYMGGPMYYASKVGLKNVYEKICYYHKKYPFSMHWVPSSLLARLSESNLPLSQWGKAAKGSKL